MQFLSNDPPEFLDLATMRDVMAHHEAGHALLAFYYGYQIGGYTCKFTGKDWTGSVKNRRIANPPIVDTIPNLSAESQKLLAGELAARIRTGITTDAIVLPLTRPKPEAVTYHTSLEDLYPCNDQSHDAIRALSRFVSNRNHIQDTWWNWIWTRHDETRRLLKDHWPIVEAMARRFLTVDPIEIEPDTGYKVGRVNGDVVIQWCNDTSAPIYDQNVISVSY